MENQTVVTVILILVGWLALLASVGDGVVVSHDVRERELDHQLAIQYGNPCLNLKNKDNLINDEGRNHDARIHQNFIFNQCEIHYAKDWLAGLRNFTRCIPDRFKRSSTLVAKVLPKATSLITSALLRRGTDTKPTSVHNVYNLDTDINVNIMRDVFTNTQNIVRMDEKLAEVKHFPFDVYGAYQAHKSIAGKSALLNHITSVCYKNKQLNLEAVQALLETSERLNYRQEETKITDVRVDNSKSELIITFDYIHDAILEPKNSASSPVEGTNPKDAETGNHGPANHSTQSLLATQNIIFLCLNISFVIILFVFYLCCKPQPPVTPENLASPQTPWTLDS